MWSAISWLKISFFLLMSKYNKFFPEKPFIFYDKICEFKFDGKTVNVRVNWNLGSEAAKTYGG